MLGNMYDKFGRDLAAAETEMCRLYLDVTKKSQSKKCENDKDNIEEQWADYAAFGYATQHRVRRKLPTNKISLMLIPMIKI